MKTLMCITIICAVMLSAVSSQAAKTTGNVKVLCLRVLFSDYTDAPDLGTITNKIKSAKTQYAKFSYDRMNLSYDTCTVTLNKRSSYSGGTLAAAAIEQAKAQGYTYNYDIYAVFHGSHPVGSKAIVGGNKLWVAGKGGALVHEMGHCFGWGHQKRWAAKKEGTSPYNPIDNNGNADVIDVWCFMKTSTMASEPAENWRAGWLDDYYHMKQGTNTTVRLYNYDEKNANPPNGGLRALRVERSAATKKYYWIGYRSVLLNNEGETTKNYHMRQGLVFYWERAAQASNGELGNASPVALDLHYGGGKGTDDLALQPGETYSDTVSGTVGNVHITNLGRGGTAPNEYIDVRVNTGRFPSNRPPEATWDAPYTLKTGETVVLNVEPNDPDGDPVACMWKKSNGSIPENTIGTTMSWSWSGTGDKKISVAVSDMKGGLKRLTRTITVVDDYSVSQWEGGSTNEAWNTVSNWVAGVEPSTKTEIASWSGAFTGANQPLLDTNVLNRVVHQLRLEPSLDKDVTLTLLETNNTLKVYGGIDMSAADQNLSVGGDGTVLVQTYQPWVVSTGATLTVNAAIDLKSNQLTLESQGNTEIAGDVSGGGTFVKTGSGTLSISSGSMDLQNIIVEEGGLSLGSSASIDTFTITNNLTINGGLLIDIDPSATPSCDVVEVLGTLAGNGNGILQVSNLGPSTFTTGQIFQVFNQPFPDGATMAIDPVEPAPGLIWVNRLAIDGSIAVIPAPPAGTFDDWAKIGSSLFGPEAKFESDPNGDGLKNGLAYFLGASLATDDSTALLPVWNYTPTNATFVVTYRRLDEATNQTYSAIEYTTNLTDWILAVDGEDGIMETVDDDFYGTGIDRVTVCLCDELAPGGQLFGRLVVLDRLSPEVVLPHYDAWAIGIGLVGFELDPTLDLDGDGRTNVEEFLGGTDPRNPASK